MKNLVFALLGLFVFGGTFAQECDENFYRMEPGSTFHLTYYNKKDKVTARQENVVTDTNNNGNTLEATVGSKVFDRKDKLISDGSFTVICEGSTVKVDLNQMLQSIDQLKSMQGMDTEIETDYLSLPSDMSVGQELPDSKTTITVKMGNGGANMMTGEVLIADRKVVGQEEVTTPAGTFNCYKITYSTNVNMKTLVMNRATSYPGVHWFARNVGMVKSESYNQKGELDSYALLTKLE